MLNRFSLLLWLSLVALLAFACSNSSMEGETSSQANVPENSGVQGTLDSARGMVRIESKGAFVMLGNPSDDVKLNEQGQLKVLFDYDFSIGRHEVTCDEFEKLMTVENTDCENGSAPVSNVTFWDAVLFANEKSKSEGLDTAYTYSSATLDKAGHCIGLEGLSFHADVEAYRLPTEAEWMLAASQGFKVSDAWTAENSGFAKHEICSLPANDLQICDMAGNVMEWVNDWLGYFKDTTIVDFLGAVDGGGNGERVVKGGCFHTEASAVNLFSRGDVYAVTSATKADYVGFRLAFGTIPNPSWLSSDGKPTSSQKIPLANSSTIRSLTGTYKVKLAFRDDVSGNLAFIDYANGLTSINEIEDTLDVFHPDVSPDGKRVAFCTGLEGVRGKSSLYVRNLDASGSGLVKLDVQSAAIPRWRVLENGDTVIVYVTNAIDNGDSLEWISQSTWQVPFANGAFGTPEMLMKGTFHGGISPDGKLAVSGSRLLRARVAEGEMSVYSENAENLVWYGGEQACNVSLSMDGSDRTLFLDFGGSTGESFVGEKYGVHERLLIADADGNLVQSVKSPAKRAFDHAEWALNIPDVVVATVATADGVHDKIVAVDLRSGLIVNLVEGDELWHPCLWVNQNMPANDSKLDADSAGVYMLAYDSEAAIFLRYKLDLLWNLRDSANVIILGSSRPLNAIIPLELDEKFFAINMTNVPNTMAVSQYLFENYVVPHVEKLKYLVISLDIDMWWKSDYNDDNFFYEEYKKYPGYVYDKNHNFWKDGYPEGLAESARNCLGADFYTANFIESRGYNDQMRTNPSYSIIGWEDNPAVEHDSTWLNSNSEEFEAAFEHLKSMIKMAENRGVYVIGVVFPQSPNFRKTGSFGRYGIRRSEAPAILGRLEKLTESYSNFIFMDENKMGNHDYTDDMAENKDHLAYRGALQFTSRLNDLLLGLE